MCRSMNMPAIPHTNNKMHMYTHACPHPMPTCACINMHTCAYINVHTLIHTSLHVHTSTQNFCVPTHRTRLIYVHINTCKQIHTKTHMYKHIPTSACTHKHVESNIHSACTHTCSNAFLHIQKHCVNHMSTCTYM